MVGGPPPNRARTDFRAKGVRRAGGLEGPHASWCSPGRDNEERLRGCLHPTSEPRDREAWLLLRDTEEIADGGPLRSRRELVRTGRRAVSMVVTRASEAHGGGRIDIGKQGWSDGMGRECYRMQRR